MNALICDRDESVNVVNLFGSVSNDYEKAFSFQANSRKKIFFIFTHLHTWIINLQNINMSPCKWPSKHYNLAADVLNAYDHENWEQVHKISFIANTCENAPT